MRRFLPWLILAPMLLVLAGAAVIAWLGKQPEPRYDGEVTLPGLAAPVEVVFGPHAVPSITADSIDDLLFAQGYIVAAERMWQMDVLRRVAGGRLAEVFGEGGLVLDRYYRTMGLPRAAREAYAALEPRDRRLVERYTDGVNAYLAEAAGRPPLEYRLAGIEPARWAPIDSLVIGEYMAWINSVNLREELTFLRLAARLGTARALGLFPADVGVPAQADAGDLPDYAGFAGVDLPRMALAGIPGPGAASNAWAVTGARSAGTDALLASDPHLEPAMPGIWYELEMRAPGYHAAGVSLPGVPLILLGHNAHLAWGITASIVDTQDLFLERLSDSGDAVLRPGGVTEPIVSRREPIPVAGRAEPAELVIRSTSNGVLIDELLHGSDDVPAANPEGLPAPRRPERLAAKLTLDQPERSIAGLWRLNVAETLDEARAAVLDLRHVAVSVLIAHRDGGLAWQVSGLLPDRNGGSSTFPAAGWRTGPGWQGLLPQSANPGLTAPADDKLVSANHRMVPVDYPVDLGQSWLSPYRAKRIEALLAAADEPLDAAAMARMQLDRISLEAQVYLASLRRHLPAIRASDPDAARIADRHLLDWSGGFTGDSQAAALFALLEPALYETLYGDELGDDLRALMALATVSYGPLEEALRSDASSFWDDVTTPDVREGPAEVWARALRRADEGLATQQPNPDLRRLDRLRSLTFRHAFDGRPLIGRLFNVGPIGFGGDSATINVASVSPTAPRRVGYIPSVRVVFTPSDWSRTRGTLPLGQSGHRLSPYRSDQLEDWLDGRTHPWPWNGPAAGTAIGELRLVPAAGAAGGRG
jgi:acyl-homoserine lactone acylase PvdQ